MALRAGADSLLAVDLDEVSLAQGVLMARLQGTSESLTFRRMDVFDLTEEFDFGICAGGLYHLEDPARLLRQLRGIIRHALVVQTVYSKANDSADYFETPAPAWTWGCRFSYEYLLRMVEGAGWNILHAETNELLGNGRLEDRGSAYLLCVPND
jgi:2-polyprenyl-3-methyl-5-hydroxy-6-metoxy-1,4-benzoquinol methylase